MKVHKFQMFTQEGNDQVAKLVNSLISSHASLDEKADLYLVGFYRIRDEYPEIFDTAVRDAIWTELKINLGVEAAEKIMNTKAI